MGTRADISQPIIEALYCEALLLADDVREAFDLSARHDCGGEFGIEHDKTRFALSVEGLRTTTRVMHVLAWLLNHRAFLSGDMSEFQLRRHGRLPADRGSEQGNLDLLEPATVELVRASEALHARIARLDKAWREGFEMHPSAVLRLRERLGRAVEGI